MPSVERVLGHAADACFAGREHDVLLLTAAESAQPRVRRYSENGTELTLALPRGTFLHAGAVLADDGQRIVVVERRLEQALVITAPQDFAAGLALGYLLGNQHSSVDLCEGELRVPLVTSEQAAIASAARIGLAAEVRWVKLAEQGWWRGSGTHEHGS